MPDPLVATRRRGEAYFGGKMAKYCFFEVEKLKMGGFWSKIEFDRVWDCFGRVGGVRPGLF